MKKIIALLIALAALVGALAACSKDEPNHPEGVELIKEECALIGDVERSGSNAVMRCRVAIRNSTDKSAAVKLYANFPEEYKDGMYAIDFAVGKVDGSEMLAVPANETVTVEAEFEVPLAANYTGEALKKDSSVPAIAINEVDVSAELASMFGEK